MIMAILVCVALPSYNHSIIQSHRVDGKIGLLQLAAQLEKGSGRYSDVSPEGFYKLVIIEKDNDNYLIAAYPLKSQLNDKTCGIFALNSRGQKGILQANHLIQNKQCW
jgi:Tfp pilus assembly protein PilE